MPNRIIKESICTSENLDQLTAFQETVFYRLLVNADDFGRMDARPRILASKLFPLKDIRLNQIEDAVRALTSAELVIPYVVDGKPFLQMKTWDQHQQIRAKRSKYPGIDEGMISNDITCNQMISDDINCKQMISNDIKCSRNPIQSESNPNPNPYSTELSSAQIATLPLIDGTTFNITEEDAKKDAEAFPALDVKKEYLQMSRWLEANPRNRKTRNGIRRFINSWLERSQDKAPRVAAPKQVTAQRYEQRSYTEDQLAGLSDDLRKALEEKYGT